MTSLQACLIPTIALLTGLHHQARRATADFHSIIRAPVPGIDLAHAGEIEAGDGRPQVGDVARMVQQRHRLGIGQVLDYAVTLRSCLPNGVETIRPVLVLEKQPADPARWEAVAAAAGIELTWAPDFAGLLD